MNFIYFYSVWLQLWSILYYFNYIPIAPLYEILIISFKRFNKYNKKINTIITTPTKNLDLSKYVVGYDKESYKYDLFGICNHSGGCLGGHYTAFVKNANGKWYEFNDTSIREMKESEIVSSRSYCFFYRKKV